MKIAIVTAYYEPIPAPRAFRAAELAREFVRRGYEVSVFNTTSVIRDGVNVSGCNRILQKPEIEQKRNGINLNSENIFFILQPIPG